MKTNETNGLQTNEKSRNYAFVEASGRPHKADNFFTYCMRKFTTNSKLFDDILTFREILKHLIRLSQFNNAF